jgi:hypothetical protein
MYFDSLCFYFDVRYSHSSSVSITFIIRDSISLITLVKCVSAVLSAIVSSGTSLVHTKWNAWLFSIITVSSGTSWDNRKSKARLFYIFYNFFLIISVLMCFVYLYTTVAIRLASYYLYLMYFNLLVYKQTANSVAWVGERTIPIERPPLFGEASANFWGKKSVA